MPPDPGAQEMLSAASHFWGRPAQAPGDYSGVLDALMNILDAKDGYTASHCRRVQGLTQLVALQMDLNSHRVRTALLAALYHDVGKLGMANSLLSKPGSLSRHERRLIMTHPTVGRELVDNSLAMHRAALAIEQHHESWDGSGYPWGLKQEQILPEARVLRVCDVYDALTSDRPYRRAFSHADALDIITAGIGTEFEPDAARALLAITAQLERVA